MCVEATDWNEHKVWLTDNEIEVLRRATNSQRDDLSIQFGAFVGLRALEIPQVRPGTSSRLTAGNIGSVSKPGKTPTATAGNPTMPSFPTTSSTTSNATRTNTTLLRKSLYSFETARRPRRDPPDSRAGSSGHGRRRFRGGVESDLRRRFAKCLLVDERMDPPHRDCHQRLGLIRCHRTLPERARASYIL